MFKKLTSRMRAAYVVVLSAFMSVFVAAPALATESEGAKAVKTATGLVSTEGIEIIIAVLTGLVGLIALSIVLPKAIGFIRRFI
jgi:hypothetical protein